MNDTTPDFGQPFVLLRTDDVSGVSGTGIVANGILWPDGHAAIHWTGHPYPTTTPHPAGMESVLAIHGHGGATRVIWKEIKGPPRADYGSVWPELVGYVQQAADDGTPIDPAELGAYMRELRRKALAPTREWIDRIVQQPRGEQP